MSLPSPPSCGADLQAEHAYDAVWRMPEDIERLFREIAADNYTLNVCAGKLDVGDVLVDADPQLSRALPADMNRLPFDDAVFDLVIFDPPWKVEILDRHPPFYECLRVLKPGGLLLANQTWIGESDQTEIEPPLLVRADDPWANVSVIAAHRKLPEQTELDQFGAGVDAVPTRPNPVKWETCRACGERVHVSETVESTALYPPWFCSMGCLREAEAALLEPDEELTCYAGAVDEAPSASVESPDESRHPGKVYNQN